MGAERWILNITQQLKTFLISLMASTSSSKRKRIFAKNKSIPLKSEQMIRKAQIK